MSETEKYEGDSTERPTRKFTEETRRQKTRRDTEQDLITDLEPAGLDQDLSDITITEAEKELEQAHMDLKTANKLIRTLEEHVGTLEADNFQLSGGNEGMYNIARELCGQMTSIYDKLRTSGVSHDALELLNVESTRVYKLLDKIVADSKSGDWPQRRNDLIQASKEARDRVEDYKKQVEILQKEIEIAQQRAEAVEVISGENKQLRVRVNELEVAIMNSSDAVAAERDAVAADRAMLQLHVSELEQNLALKSDIFNNNAKAMTSRYNESQVENSNLREANEKLAKDNGHLNYDNARLQEFLFDKEKELAVSNRAHARVRKFSLAGWTSALAASLVAGFVYFNGLEAVANEEPKPKVEYSEPVKVVPEPVFKYVNNRFVAEFGEEKYSLSLKKADEIMSEMEKSGKELSPAEMKKYFAKRAVKELRIEEDK